MTNVRILTGAPVISCIADMRLVDDGLKEMMRWVGEHRPECLPESYDLEGGNWEELFPHDCTYDGSGYTYDGSGTVVAYISDNEALVELAGRKCYDSFGLKAGRKSNKEYIQHALTTGPFGHASISYHAKMSFFIGGVSRRVSHELIRHFVGADRDEEGNPSQESTRFTHHYGTFICPPKYLIPSANGDEMIDSFKKKMQRAYDSYLDAINREVQAHKDANGGAEPKGMDRKRIYEAAAGFLPMQAETSFIWTTNPAALTKLFMERCDEAADLEFRRFADTWKSLCLRRWPNLFPKLV